MNKQCYRCSCRFNGITMQAAVGVDRRQLWQEVSNVNGLKIIDRRVAKAVGSHFKCNPTDRMNETHMGFPERVDTTLTRTEQIGPRFWTLALHTKALLLGRSDDLPS